MVVKKKKLKTKRKIKTTKRRRKNPNPSLFVIRDHMEIKTKPLNDGTGRYFLAVYYAGQPIIRETISAKGAALINTSAGRDRIARDIKDVIEELGENKVRTNPEKEEKEDKPKKTSSSSEWTSPVGLPASQLESWRLGYHAGLEEGIGLCGIFDFFKRREVKEMLSQKVNQHFKDLTSQLKAAGGIVGARVPRVRAGSN